MLITQQVHWKSSFAIFDYPPTPRFHDLAPVFPACPPFVNTVYRVGHRVGHALSQVLFTPSRETIPEVLVKINSASFLLFSKEANGFRRHGLEIFLYNLRVIPPCHSFVHSACRMSLKQVYFF